MKVLRVARHMRRSLLQASGAEGCPGAAASLSSCSYAGPALEGSGRGSWGWHQQRRAACCGQQGTETPQPPVPWPTRRRALHCTAERQQAAAMPQASQQQQQEEEEGASEDAAAMSHREAVGAAAAATLSGTAVRLSGGGDPFLLGVDAEEGPIAAYKEGREKGMYRKDERQELTISRIQRLYEDLKARLGGEQALRKGRGLTLVDASTPSGGPTGSSGSKGGGWFSGLFGGGRQESTAAAAPPPKGLYMYGGVGVGKTMLMDLLAAHAPAYMQLERTHFHNFMIGVHQRLRHFASMPDPLSHVADEIVDQTKVLCLDEFFVTDVADAMILHRLFARLWDRGLVLVSTSNRHPDALYEGGLQRNLFLPFIQRLKDQCEVHDMDSRTDYRKLAQHHRGLYFVTPSREEELYERFLELTNGQPVGKQYVEVAMGRQLELPRSGGCVALFTFDELCNRPLGAADYIGLANAKHTLALSGVPVFRASNQQAAYRFLTLVDVLYEHRVRFLCSAEAMPFELFENIQTNAESKASAAAAGHGGGRSMYASGGHGGGQGAAGGQSKVVVDDNLGFSKERTISRLTEMQSEEYLRAHAKAHAPELLLAMRQGKQASGSSSSSSGGGGGGQRR